MGATWDNLTKSAQPAPTPGATQSGSAQTATGQKPVADVPAKKLHRVRPGDTLSGIAKEYLGAGGSSDAILKANPQLKRGRSLKIGEMLFIPEKAVPAVASAAKSLTAQSAAAPNAAAATYQVRDGDTFYSIAKDVYGDSSKWGELYRLNRALVKGDPKRLKPGMVLKLLK